MKLSTSQPLTTFFFFSVFPNRCLRGQVCLFQTFYCQSRANFQEERNRCILVVWHVEIQPSSDLSICSQFRFSKNPDYFFWGGETFKYTRITFGGKKAVHWGSNLYHKNIIQVLRRKMGDFEINISFNHQSEKLRYYDFNVTFGRTKIFVKNLQFYRNEVVLFISWSTKSLKKTPPKQIHKIAPRVAFPNQTWPLSTKVCPHTIPSDVMKAQYK